MNDWFTERCERLGLRIWAVGMSMVLLTAIFSPIFPWRATLTGGAPRVLWVFSRFVVRTFAGHFPPENSPPLSFKGTNISWIFFIRMINLLQRMAAVGFLLVSFSPFLTAFQLWGWLPVTSSDIPSGRY